MGVVLDADQLQIKVHLTGGAGDRALDDGVDAERLCNLRQRDICGLVVHHGGARRNAEGRVPGQHGDEFVGHPVCEVLLTGVAGVVCKRKNRYRPDRLIDAVTSATLSEQAAAGRDCAHSKEDSGEHTQAHPDAVPSDSVRDSGSIGGGHGLRLRRELFGGVRLGFGRQLFFDELRRCNEAIPHAGNRLNETRALRVIPQRGANLAHGRVDAVLGVDEDLVAPQALGDLGTGHETALTGREQHQQFERLLFEPQRMAVAEQPKGAGVEPELAELVDGIPQGRSQE